MINITFRIQYTVLFARLRRFVCIVHVQYLFYVFFFSISYLISARAQDRTAPNGNNNKIHVNQKREKLNSLRRDAIRMASVCTIAFFSLLPTSISVALILVCRSTVRAKNVKCAHLRFQVFCHTRYSRWFCIFLQRWHCIAFSGLFKWYQYRFYW